MLLTVFLVYWILNHQSQIPISSWIIKNIQLARDFYSERPVFSIFIFCIAHFVSATFSIPGSCTTLNIFSGAVFGLYKGIIVVYLVTVLSGCVGYYIGSKLPFKSLEQKYKKQIETLKNSLQSNGHSYLILVRLSPLLPYGVINMLFGFINIPFFTYLITTIVGIFFDVVLLNSIGSFITDGPAFHTDKRYLALVFFLLFISSFFVKLLRSKWIDFKNRSASVKE